MKKRDLIEDLKDVDDDATIVISKCFVIDEKDDVTAILDVPVVGTAYNKNENETELRFVLSLDDVKKCFFPKDVKFFPKDAVSDREVE